MEDKLPLSEFSSDPIRVPIQELLVPPSEMRRTVTEDRYVTPAPTRLIARRRR
ncbi:hypothetical protein [Mycetocola sp.]|uniref:hypothetical protein n=1 Tax=Mycetocola sp. TaxID=1871042 RepID=UPI003988C83E